jgi:hypothetical protein
MTDPSSRRKLAAILSADVVGYSCLMAADEAATVETLKAYRDIITRWRFVNGARGAELPDCVPADKLKDMPNLMGVKSCDEQRAKITG